MEKANHPTNDALKASFFRKAVWVEHVYIQVHKSVIISSIKDREFELFICVTLSWMWDIKLSISVQKVIMNTHDVNNNYLYIAQNSGYQITLQISVH